MKNRNKKTFGILWMLIIAGLLFMTAPSQAQVVKSFGITNLVIAGPSTNNFGTTNPPVQIWSGRGYALAPMLVGTNSGTSNVVFGFNVSVDGTNFSTTLPITVTNSANGTNPVVGYTLIGPAVLNNARWWRLDQIVTSQTNSLTIQKVIGGYFP